MTTYEYWVLVCSILVKILAISLSWNTIYWIKDKTTKRLSFLLLIGCYNWILVKISVDDYHIATHGGQTYDGQIETFVWQFMNHGKAYLLCSFALALVSLILLIALFIRRLNKGKINFK